MNKIYAIPTQNEPTKMTGKMRHNNKFSFNKQTVISCMTNVSKKPANPLRSNVEKLTKTFSRCSN